MYKIIKSNEGTVRKISENKSAINYVTKEFSPNFSFAITHAENYSESEVADYDRIYYILEGSIKIECEEEIIDLEKGDCLFITKGTKMKMRGSFTSIVVNQPAFGS